MPKGIASYDCLIRGDYKTGKLAYQARGLINPAILYIGFQVTEEMKKSLPGLACIFPERTELFATLFPFIYNFDPTPDLYVNTTLYQEPTFRGVVYSISL